MMRTNFSAATTLLTTLSTAMLLSACGGSNSSNPLNDEVADFETGVFVDAPVRGMHYRSSFRGQTNGNGEFLYAPGDSVRFELGDYEFPEIPGAPVVTIVDLFDSGIVDRRVLTLHGCSRALISIPQQQTCWKFRTWKALIYEI